MQMQLPSESELRFFMRINMMLNNEKRLLEDEVEVILETGKAEDAEIEGYATELYEEQEAHRQHGFYVPTREELLEDMGEIFRHLASNY